MYQGAKLTRYVKAPFAGLAKNKQNPKGSNRLTMRYLRLSMTGIVAMILRRCLLVRYFDREGTSFQHYVSYSQYGGYLGDGPRILYEDSIMALLKSLCRIRNLDRSSCLESY